MYLYSVSKFPVVGENRNNGRYTDSITPVEFSSVSAMLTRFYFNIKLEEIEFSRSS